MTGRSKDKYMTTRSHICGEKGIHPITAEDDEYISLIDGKYRFTIKL